MEQNTNTSRDLKHEINQLKNTLSTNKVSAQYFYWLIR